MRSFILTSKIFAGMVAFLVTAEVILSFLPVATAFDRDLSEFPIRHWKPNSDYVYSNGWNFRNPQQGRVNNYGYANAGDYQKGGADILIIGDSYIEAQQVEQEMTVRAVIQRKTGLNTYSIGVNDSQFADYIKYLEYGYSEFFPKFVVIKSFDSDLYASLENIKPHGSYLIDCDDTFCLTTNPYDLKDSKLRNILKRSSFLRYVFLNLRVPKKILEDIAKLRRTSSPPILAEKENYPTQKILRFFEKKLQEMGINKQNVILITDSVNTSELFKKNGFNIINSRLTIERFEGKTNYQGTYKPYDGHWNFRGHYVIGERISSLIISLMARTN